MIIRRERTRAKHSMEVTSGDNCMGDHDGNKDESDSVGPGVGFHTGPEAASEAGAGRGGSVGGG